MLNQFLNCDRRAWINGKNKQILNNKKALEKRLWHYSEAVKLVSYYVQWRWGGIVQSEGLA
jgi:hypothetical protein